jgi:hypothetical protein
MFATSPEAGKLPAGTTGKLLWEGWIANWPHVIPGVHAAVELPDGYVVYIPIWYLLGPLGESMVWLDP